ncbi:MAG TPA: hypothetical protein VNA17_10965 [Pyrinomonadaceae bacterium]|nr:hypothetical protein [Pyrinomonadaceae bacterium]
MRSRAIAPLVILAATSLACFFSTSSTTIRGKVHYDDKPVEGVEVSFGAVGAESKVTTGPDGKFTITAKHRPAAMLRVNITKPGYGQREKIEFPGFAAPSEEVDIELIAIIQPTRR